MSTKVREPNTSASASVTPATMERQRTIPLLVGLGISAVALLTYVVTLSPTVNFVDSGELITVGVTAGVAHAPGYPLYTLMLILAAALPVGEVAVRVNAISALAGALAVGLFYAFTYELLSHHINRGGLRGASAELDGRARNGSGRTTRLTQSRPGSRPATTKSPAPGKAPPSPPQSMPRVAYAPGAPDSLPLVPVFVSAGVALLLAFCYLFWNWATQAKMYTLHFAFVGGLLWLAMRARRAMREGYSPGPLRPFSAWPPPARLLLALAVTLGLSFTNHYMTWLLIPSLAILVLWPDRARSEAASSASAAGHTPPWRWLVRYAPALAVAGLAPLLLYLYLPLRASQHPVIDWGTPDNWADFWRHITVWELRPYIGSRGNPLNFLGDAWGYALDQFGPLLGAVLALFAAAGVIRLVRSNVPLLLATAITALATLIYSLLYQLDGTSVYYVPMYMMVLAWAGIGLDQAVRALARQLGVRSAPTRDDLGYTARTGRALGLTPQAAPASAGLGLALALLPLLPAVPAFGVNFGRAGHANDYVAKAYVRNGFNNFAPNAVVLTNHYDFVGPSYYLQYVLHERPDVAVIDKNLVRYPFYIDYIDRQYGALLAPLKDAEDRYKAQEKLWVDGHATSQLGASYVEFLRAIITHALDTGRPVYLHWTTTGAEENAISKDFPTHPEGIALRVDRQKFTGPPPDPHVDLRGILTDPIELDELDFPIATLYPRVFDRMATYASDNNHPTEAAHFQNLARQVRVALQLPLQ